MDQHSIEIAPHAVDDFALALRVVGNHDDIANRTERRAGTGGGDRAAAISGSSSKRKARRPNGKASIKTASGLGRGEGWQQRRPAVAPQRVNRLGRPAVSTSSEALRRGPGSAAAARIGRPAAERSTGQGFSARDERHRDARRARALRRCAARAADARSRADAGHRTGRSRSRGSRHARLTAHAAAPEGRRRPRQAGAAAMAHVVLAPDISPARRLGEGGARPRSTIKLRAAAAKAGASPGGTRRPVSPATTISPTPPLAPATTGKPLACASSSAMPNASLSPRPYIKIGSS